MTCVNWLAFVGYTCFAAILFGFPFLYLSARRFGRALESHESVKKEALGFGLKLAAAILVAGGVIWFMGFVPVIPC